MHCLPFRSCKGTEGSSQQFPAESLLRASVFEPLHNASGAGANAVYLAKQEDVLLKLLFLFASAVPDGFVQRDEKLRIIIRAGVYSTIAAEMGRLDKLMFPPDEHGPIRA